MRLATPAEIGGVELGEIDPARFIYAMVRKTPGAAELQIIIAAFPLLPLADIGEAEIAAAWFQGDAIVGAKIERALQ